MSFSTLTKRSKEAYRSNAPMERIDIFKDSHLTVAERKSYVEDRIREYSDKLKFSDNIAKAQWATNLLAHVHNYHESAHCKLTPYQLNQEWLHGLLSYFTKTQHKRKITNKGILQHIEMISAVFDFWNLKYEWILPNYLHIIEPRKQLADEILSDEEVEVFWKLEAELGRLPAYGKVGINKSKRFHVVNLTLDAFLISLYTGVRYCEVKTIFTSYDVKSQTDLLGYYAGKNKKAKFINMHPRIKHLIEREWYKQCPRTPAWEALVKHVNITGQGQIIERIGQTLNRRIVPRTQIIHFHSARKTFTVRCIEAGMDIYELSKLLGHSSVQITEQFYAFAREEHMIKRTNEVFARIA